MVVEGATCEFLPKATIDSRIGTAFIHTSNLYNHRLHKLVAHTAAPLGQAGGFSEETRNFATHNIHSGATFCSTDLEKVQKQHENDLKVQLFQQWILKINSWVSNSYITD